MNCQPTMPTETWPTFSPQTTAEEVADTFASILEGKNALITGTSLNGMGYEAARVIAKHARLVIITGYNEDRLQLFRLKRSAEEIKKSVPTANIRCLTLDLSSQSSVREAAAQVNSYSEPLHVLIHNAAALNLDADTVFKRTVDLDVDVQWATNHFGPFLLTKLLLPQLLAATSSSWTSRVVHVSAKGHQFGTGVDLENLGRPDPTAEGNSAMGINFSTKSANIMTASELSRRAGGRIHAYSLHPGIVYSNAFTRPKEKKSLPPELTAIGLIDENGDPVPGKFAWKSIEEGSATMVAAAFDPRLDSTPGAYLEDCQVAMTEVAPHTADPVKAAKLWDLTEEIIGEKFEF
ncbi:Short-chain dehydrogenase/reductase family protein [Mycena indigotica]|uniref:Short-chain dehydrogenase/reductase family protein n=1 Tax=Mycena indigotica TaxID=2126181 RepID=A0A8H6S993_9AGAR|nr:Short-chain dehydrogenase/reductase family protein [Mycena indigotica]KAF7294540.1 Short-chain dehydrogenase/reductase family protein [Mycena indigotica]